MKEFANGHVFSSIPFAQAFPALFRETGVDSQHPNEDLVVLDPVNGLELHQREHSSVAEDLRIGGAPTSLGSFFGDLHYGGEILPSNGSF